MKLPTQNQKLKKEEILQILNLIFKLMDKFIKLLYKFGFIVCGCVFVAYLIEVLAFLICIVLTSWTNLIIEYDSKCERVLQLKNFHNQQ
ncbi:hypothetical protein FGO68_gene3482 [Halteria grandinella]|uniref:Transmembrane protein n=1 Tax=Halteria grandinella TaxID=5974 RepID=A0A8J8N972_HALGN|nr:hypothetical protein FGO68_gene3482 [Halteria grandinella]